MQLANHQCKGTLRKKQFKIRHAYIKRKNISKLYMHTLRGKNSSKSNMY